MKIFRYAAIAIITLTLAACSGKGTKTEAESDSAAEEQVETADIFSPDLAFAELRGHVKMCRQTSVAETPEGTSITITEYSFDEAGHLVGLKSYMRTQDGEIPVEDMHFDYDEDGVLLSAANNSGYGTDKIATVRDEEGRIIRIETLNAESESAYSTDYEWEGFGITGERYRDMNGLRIVTTRFDDSDYVTTRKVIYKTEEGDLTESYTYSTEGTDASGNWIERNASVTVSENLTEAAEGDVNTHGPFTLTETREITYY